MPSEFELSCQARDKAIEDQNAARQQAAKDQERRIAQLKELWATLGLEEIIEKAAAKLAPSGITPVTIEKKGWPAHGTGLQELIRMPSFEGGQPDHSKVLRAVLFQYNDTEGLAALKFPKDQTFIAIGHNLITGSGWNWWEEGLGIKRLPSKKRRGEQQIVLPSGVEPFDPANGDHYKDLLDKSLVAMGERYYRPKDLRSMWDLL